MSRQDLNAIALLFLVAAGTSLPFARRAYFVDDYYFVSMAKGILQNPRRPYDFKFDDGGLGKVGWEPGQRPRMVNPPLFHYYLAGVIALFGEAPWKLRSSTLIFSLAALFSMYFLGKRLVRDPLRAALLLAVCPVYWLTSYSLLIDSALIAFLLVSLHAFFIGQEKRHPGWIVLSGCLMGLTMLVKYFGVIVVALALVWQLVDPGRRRWLFGYAAYACFLAVQFLWGFWNIATYGRTHFFAALPRGMSAPSVIIWAQKALVLGSFVGGGLIFVLVAIPILWRASQGWRFGLSGLFAALTLLFSSSLGGFSWDQSLLLTLFIGGTAAFLIFMGRTMKPDKDPKHLFLGLWVLGGLLELVIVMPWTAGRYLLCILPAMCWVFALMIDEFGAEGRQTLWRAALAGTALMGLLLAHADFVQADTIVRLAEALRRKAPELQAIAPRPPARWYYMADAFDGSQPYMLPLNWENMVVHQTFQPGDLLLRAYYRKSAWWNMTEEMKHQRPVYRFEFWSWNPLRVMDVPASAGFYASCWGALPWAITNHPLERFELYQAVTD